MVVTFVWKLIKNISPDDAKEYERMNWQHENQIFGGEENGKTIFQRRLAFGVCIYQNSQHIMAWINV